MKKLLAIALLTPALALAQTAVGPPSEQVTIPKASAKADSKDVKGAFCEIWWMVDGDVTMPDGSVVDGGITAGYGPPTAWADVEDNFNRSKKVLDVMSKQQDKGGPYSTVATQLRRCDGGQVTQIMDGGIEVRGVTAKGAVEINRVALKQLAEVNELRFAKRADKGDKYLQDHSKAKKAKRDDLGRKVRDDK
jgi:hypothetical protein